MEKQRDFVVHLLLFVTAIGLLFVASPGSSPLVEQTRRVFKRTDVANGIELRIQPLGDSITYGFQSSDYNGYRGELYDKLAGSKLRFIGSQKAGNMPDNHNEGHSGATINEIAAFAINSLPQRPNMVLLHAGTNDLNADPPKDPYDSAPARLGRLLDQIISACPDATILVAKIIHPDNAGGAARVAAYNAQIPRLVADRIAAGHVNMAVVDFTSIGAEADLVDHIHPTDATYKKMGDIWFDAIQEAASQDWIKAPIGPDPPPDSGPSSANSECLSGLFLFQADGGALVASGNGQNGDHKFTNNWAPPVKIAAGFGLNYTGVRLADLDGDGKLYSFACTVAISSRLGPF